MLHMFVRFRLGKVWLTSNQKYCLFVYIFFSGTVKIELWLFLRCRFIDLFSIPGIFDEKKFQINFVFDPTLFLLNSMHCMLRMTLHILDT